MQGGEQGSHLEEVGLLGLEEALDVEEQLLSDRAFLVTGKGLTRLPGAFGPDAAHEVSDRQQWAPVVGGPVVKTGRDLRIGLSEALDVIRSPSSASGSQLGEVPLLGVPEPFDLLRREPSVASGC